MIDLTEIEATYREFISDLPQWLPDGIESINLNQLHSLGLTRITDEKPSELASITRQFHVIESEEKITLFNQHYLIWLVPQNDQDEASTIGFIALNSTQPPQLELAFQTKGVYNTSKMVLNILERHLLDIQENERLINALGQS
jgi:hypothetical protein